MKNMPINIHFFRSGTQGRVNYQEILDYFQDLPNFEIYYDNDEVDIIYTDDEFGFQYEYKITKVSQVKAIYKLNPAYLNINFMLCLPLLIPGFAIREILELAQKMAKTFDLSMYHESFDDVKPFNQADLHSLCECSQRAYLEENGPGEKVLYDSDKLNVICKYQRMNENIYESLHGEVEVNLCTPIIDRNGQEFGICSEWNIGIPTLFAPYFDFVNIKDEDGEEFKIRRADFMKYMDKYLSKLDSILPDLYVLKPKQAKSSKSVVNKLRRYAIVDQEFVTLRISDLLDKETKK